MYQNYADGASKSRQMMSSFGGLNQNVYCQPNEFRDMMNLSSDAYPYLTQRARRDETDLLTNRELKASLIHDGKLAALYYYEYEREENIESCIGLWYDEKPVISDIGIAYEKCHLLSNGAELFVFPHGIVYNTLTGEKRELNSELICTYEDFSYVIYSPCNEEGEVEEGGSYIKMHLILSPNNTVGDGIEDLHPYEGDTVEIGEKLGVTGVYDLLLPSLRPQLYHTIVKSGFERRDSENPFDDPLNSGTLLEGEGIYFVFAGNLGKEYVYPYYAGFNYTDNYIYISKEIPVLDFYTVCQNRVWGCVYKDGLNEIRCSKLGDPSNWNTFDGISTDSFTASIGEEGPFTGIFSFNDEPYFFKENVVLKVYGGYPAAYQVYAFSCSGVQEGSERGITSSEGYLFYKTPNDFCVFSGSQPQSISKNLGFEKYHNVVAGAVGGKIYWSCLDENDRHILLVFDQTAGVWYKEESARILDFCQDAAGHLLGITAEKIINFEKKNAQEGEGTEWYAETGLMGLEIPDQKAVSKYTIRAELEAGATLSVLVSYDDGGFEPIYHCIGEGRLSSHTFAVKPVRCDHLRLRLEGAGKCTIYSITYTMEQRSENP